jgi:hypothetical protein
MRAFIRPFMVFYLLAGVEFAFGGWALYAILAQPDPSFPTAGTLLMVVGVVSLIVAVRGHRQERLRTRLLATGDAGTAKILELTQTGTTRNNIPLFHIRMRVHGGVHGDYEKTLKEYLPFSKALAASPGSSVAVRIDHDDREKLTIDWSVQPNTHQQRQSRS